MNHSSREQVCDFLICGFFFALQKSVKSLLVFDGSDMVWNVNPEVNSIEKNLFNQMYYLFLARNG